MPWDVFISHATEDKETVAEPLRKALVAAGISVWIDNEAIALGDSMRRSMERGLSRSRWGVVVVSPAFLAKYWTQAELDALFGYETPDKKVILPVYHGIRPEDVRVTHPILAGRRAAFWSDGIDRVVADIASVVGTGAERVTPISGQPAPRSTSTGNVILILPPNGRSFFVDCESVEISEAIRIEFNPGEGDQGILAAALRERGRRPTAVAFGLRCVLGSVKSVTESFKHGKHACSLTLEEERSSGDTFLQDMSFNNISADELSEMRARRILLDERLSGLTQAGVDPFLEVLVRGMGVVLEVPSSPFPPLFKDFAGNPEAFLVAARLVGVLWLHLSGVVLDVMALDLKMQSRAQLAVHFEGQRARRFVNAEPHVLRIDGICELAQPQQESR
jgi:hypothetical protein